MVSVLFPGGRGSLELDAPADDGTTSGVSVTVKPAKKLGQRMQLLSGGERALVAIAFLMALVLARPSPLYILDEVEAALDDVNIGRLVKLLRDYRDRTQFIVITHQKPTMDAADVLYGVTMGQDGASQVVSARMAEAAIDLEADSSSANNRRRAHAPHKEEHEVEWHEAFEGVPVDAVPEELIAEEGPRAAKVSSQRFRRNLGKARNAVRQLAQGNRHRGVDQELFEQIEETLISADVGMKGTREIITQLEDVCISKQISDGERAMDRARRGRHRGPAASRSKTQAST